MPAKNLPSGTQTPARILVVDDHPLTRHGIVRLLEDEPGLVVCGEAENAARALAMVTTHKPRLILADLTMPGGDGLEFIKNVRAVHREVGILVVSMHDEELYAGRALRAGAGGYIMKDEGGEKLVAAIHQVLQGRTYVSDKMSGKLADTFAGRGRGRNDTNLGQLTDREFEVFGLIGQGLTTGEIGRRLHLSVKTVETHRLHIREKLGLASGPALIQFAVRWAGAQALI